MTETIRVLLLEDDPADARLVEHMLRRMVSTAFEVVITGRLAQATARLAQGDIQVVLADLSLPDSQGLATLTALTGAAPDLPVVVLTGNDDDAQAIEALKHGAQDYLVKGRGDAFVLSRVIRYAIERKAGQRALKEALDQAEAAARAKSLFLATVGHEIRTPLNGILGMARLLLETSLDFKQRTFAETVASSGESLLGVVNDILDFSRLEAEGLALEAVAFDLLEMVDEIRLLMAPRAAEKGLTLSCRFAPAVPSYVLGDPLRLRQVLLNLVGNAIKFTERGNVTLSVEVLGDGESGAPVLRFAVADTGIGIPEAARAGLFSEFHQADSSITRRFGGTGLGLAICKRLVTLMGGEIGYDSVTGQGSSFWFRVALPAAEAPAIAAEAEVARADGPKCRVLLVDDNPVNREVAAGLLERHGHVVTSVGDGMAAVDAMRTGNYELVLCDMRMPGVDGLETGRCIRALGGAAALTPLWLLTANPSEQDEALWREAGFDGCMAKPFRVEEAMRVLAGRAGTAGVRLVAPEPALVALPDLLADLKDLGRERMQGLAELFRTSSATDLRGACDHALSGDFLGVASAVHRMASASASLHLTALNERCRTIETLARARDANAMALVEPLEELWQRSVDALIETVL